MLGAKEDFKTSGEERTRTDLNGRRVTLTSITTVTEAEVGAQNTQHAAAKVLGPPKYQPIHASVPPNDYYQHPS